MPIRANLEFPIRADHATKERTVIRFRIGINKRFWAQFRFAEVPP